MIDLSDENIMDSKTASEMWGKSDDYVRQMYRKYPDKFPAGSIRKFGKQLVVTTEGMETVTGIRKSKLE